jgi:hypothetical protein
MASHTRITLVCDNCGCDDSLDRPVKRHRAKVDRDDIVNVDACTVCWNEAYRLFAGLLAKGNPEKGTSRWRL